MDATGSMTSVAELDVETDEDTAEEAPAYGTRSEPRRARLTASGHIAKDYSYVRSEVVRILAVAGFLITALLITSVFRG